MDNHRSYTEIKTRELSKKVKQVSNQSILKHVPAIDFINLAQLCPAILYNVNPGLINP